MRHLVHSFVAVIAAVIGIVLLWYLLKATFSIALALLAAVAFIVALVFAVMAWRSFSAHHTRPTHT